MDHLDLALRFDAPTDAGVFTGYAVVWGERNGHGEIVERGAFQASLEEHRRAGTRPLMLYAHNPRDIVGVWTEIREDEKGLFVRGQILTTIEAGREAYERLKAQALNGLSIGFRPAPGGVERRNGTVYIRKISLVEISLVGLPSAGNARVNLVRSHGRSVESAAAFVEACRKAKCALATKGK